MKHLFLMCGYPFAGKTYIANYLKKYFEAEYISLDEINRERGLGQGENEVISREDWEQTHQIALERIKNSTKTNIILDDTNYAKFLRDRFRKIGKEAGYLTYVIFINIPKKVVIERRKNNIHSIVRPKIPSAPFREVLENMEIPSQIENTIIYNYREDILEFLETVEDIIDVHERKNEESIPLNEVKRLLDHE